MAADRFLHPSRARWTSQAKSKKTSRLLLVMRIRVPVRRSWRHSHAYEHARGDATTDHPLAWPAPRERQQALCAFGSMARRRPSTAGLARWSTRSEPQRKPEPTVPATQRVSAKPIGRAKSPEVARQGLSRNRGAIDGREWAAASSCCPYGALGGSDDAYLAPAPAYIRTFDVRDFVTSRRTCSSSD
jgi:hypothetical protein